MSSTSRAAQQRDAHANHEASGCHGYHSAYAEQRRHNPDDLGLFHPGFPRWNSLSWEKCSLGWSELYSCFPGTSIDPTSPKFLLS